MRGVNEPGPVNGSSTSLDRVRRPVNSTRLLTLTFCLPLLFSGCTSAMKDDARVRPYANVVENPARGTAWTPPENAIPVGYLRADEAYYTGRKSGDFVARSPQVHSSRGAERYQIYCALCHGDDGSGPSYMVEKGMPLSVSFFDPRLMKVGDGYFYHVTANGFGRMIAMADQVSPEDRWAITAHIRKLQKRGPDKKAAK